MSYGLLWAVAAGAMESFALPLGDIGAADLLVFVATNLAAWCCAGVVVAAATMLLERHLTRTFVAPALVVFAGLVAVAVSSALRPLWDLAPVFGEGSSVHILWEGLFYGGLFVAAYRLSVRSERTRALLVQAEIARQQTETLLSTARLEALQGHVDPAFLLQAMAEVERRYADDRAGVDRLLDPLVSFLRAAMPGVRSGASTLQDEVQLAMQYNAVWAELEPGRVAWRLQVQEPMPELPVPALLLLPVLDCLSTAAGAAPLARLQVQHSGGRCSLTIERAERGPGPWLTPELSYRLQVGLRELFGDAWTLGVRTSGAASAFELTLPLAAQAPVASAPLSSPSAKEMSHE